MTGSVGIIGAGTMGTGIAYVFLAASWTTHVVEPDGTQAQRLRSQLASVAADGVRRGRVDAALGAGLADAARVVGAVGDLPVGLDLLIESVPERAALKERVLAEADARQPALLASNTSSLSIDELATARARPGSFLGMHFFNPVWSLGLVEVVRGARTTDAALEAALAAVASIGKEAAVVNDSPGFATSRLDLVTALEAMRMVEAGVASAADIDRAMRIAYRHPVGPLRLSDIVGLDVRLDIARQLARTLGPHFAPPAILVDLVTAGRLGRKTGRGFYDWEGDAG